MAQGAAYKAISSAVKFYYLKAGTSKPAIPADLAAANTIAVAANLFMHTTNDVVIPAVNGGGETPPNVTAREHGATEVIYAADITPAPTPDANTFEVQWNADMTNDLHEAILTEATGTYATIIADIQTDEGDGTRGNTAGNAEGTMVALVVQHADAPLTLPASAAFVSATTTFTVVDDSAGAKGRKVFQYGEP